MLARGLYVVKPISPPNFDLQSNQIPPLSVTFLTLLAFESWYGWLIWKIYEKEASKGQ